MPHRGNEPYPRYFTRQFRVRRSKTEVRIRVESPEKVTLRERVRELRAQGLSYPAIARTLGISEGTAWNYAHQQ